MLPELPTGVVVLLWYINGDGFLDIYVAAISKPNLNGHNELFINDGKGHFTESAAKYGLDFSGMTCQTAF